MLSIERKSNILRPRSNTKSPGISKYRHLLTQFNGQDRDKQIHGESFAKLCQFVCTVCLTTFIADVRRNTHSLKFIFCCNRIFPCKTMYNICKGSYSSCGERPNCDGVLRFPQTPAEARKWNWDAEKKNESHYKFQCSYDERRKKVEARRRRLIQKLKFEYRINVDDINNQMLEDMVLEAERIEKKKKTIERDKTERKINFLTTLVEEEKIKRRVLKPLPVPCRKLKKVRRRQISQESSSREKAEMKEFESESFSLYPEDEDRSNEADLETLADDTRLRELGKEKELDLCKPNGTPSEETILAPEFFQPQNVEVSVKISQINETQLKCTPSAVIFENCKPDKTYAQSYKIVNTGFEVIHCSFVGIESKMKDQRLPFKVELKDNVLLRPGLSFTANIQMFCRTEISQIDCFLVYETRRKKDPKKAVFRVPLTCLPERSIVEISATTISFPPVTWSIATGPERFKYLKKTIKIRNTGTKNCSCTISKQSLEDSSKMSEPYLEEGGENSLYSLSTKEESPGEDYYLLEAYEEVLDVLSELLDNVFEVFRFSQKYFINVPALSVVKLEIDFQPESRRFHHEVAYIRFEGAFNCIEEKIEMMGEIKKIPIRIEPAVMNLQVCIINSGVYEGTFKVYNDSNGSVPLRLKVPGSMKKHSLVFPRDPVIQAWSCQTCSVRLFPGLTIAQDAFRYYEEDTNILEFPVFIQMAEKNTEKWEQIKLYVFAILTNYKLELNPGEIDFGVVSTLETVRTEISLTNHSMALQEFGFLNLPMGVRIEPNNGFGAILPKETIPLYLLFSPVLGSMKNIPEKEGSYRFTIKVTSVAKLGGFGESVQEQTGTEPTDSTWNEEVIYNTETEGTPQEITSPKEPNIDEEEEEESLIDPSEELKILEDKQQRIRQYLRQKTELISPMCNTENVSVTTDEKIEPEEPYWTNFPREDMHIISCRAVVVKPFCELSSTLIQLPPTPVSSYSIARFRINLSPPEKCRCKFMKKRVSEGPSFDAFFQFHASSPLVSVEPNSGRITRGQSIPVAIIFKPEIPQEKLSYQSNILKAETLFEEESKTKGESSPPKTKSKTKSVQPGRKASRLQKVEIETQDINLSNLDITISDLFAGERALQQMIEPFNLVIKVFCVVRTFPSRDIPERTEPHTLILVAPVTRPHFILLEDCQEIKFGKVAIGNRSRKIIKIQNISLRRISPRMTALNPHGPFTCTTGSILDKVDPEHIWKHPITFAPTDEKKEVEFFEVRYGATITRLAVYGEGIEPKFSFSPDFSLCLLEGGTELTTEVEFSIENKCEAELRLTFVKEFVREKSNLRSDSTLLEKIENQKSDLSFRKQEKRTSQTGSIARKKIIFRNELSPEIVSELENEFSNLDDQFWNNFSVSGLNAYNEIVISPLSKTLLKIRFHPHKDTNASNKRGENISLSNAFAAKYKIMMGKTKIIKEVIIVGVMASEK